jgi:hypothetical protein
LPQGARDALVLCGVYGYEHQFLEWLIIWNGGSTR